MLIQLDQVQNGSQIKEAVDELVDELVVTDTIISGDKQTVFPLTKQPNHMGIEVIIDSVVYKEGDIYFTIDRDAKELTWKFTKDKSGFDILNGTEVAIKYYISMNELMKSIAKMYAGSGGTGTSGNDGSFLLNF